MEKFTIDEIFDFNLYGKKFKDNNEHIDNLFTLFEFVIYNYITKNHILDDKSLFSSGTISLIYIEKNLQNKKEKINSSNDDEPINILKRYFISRTIVSNNLAFENICSKFNLDDFGSFCLLSSIYSYFNSDIKSIARTISNYDNFTIEALAKMFFGEEYSPISTYTKITASMEKLTKIIKIKDRFHPASAEIFADKSLIDKILDSNSHNQILSELGSFCDKNDKVCDILYGQKEFEKLLSSSINANSFIKLSGKFGSGKRYLIKKLCSSQKVNGYIFDTQNVFSKDVFFNTDWVWQLEREGVCEPIICAFTHFDKINENMVSINKIYKTISRLKDKLLAVCILTEDDEYIYNDNDLVPTNINIGKINTLERTELFKLFAEPCTFDNEVNLYEISNKFKFSIGQIKQALKIAKLKSEKNIISAKALLEGCYGIGKNSLGDMATKITTPFLLSDVIMPPTQKSKLEFACSQIRNRHVVYEDWSFEKKLPYGKGTSILFYGPPGTGKTMTASAIANELGLSIYRIDTSKIMDKYIGETEKHLGELFKKAKEQSIVLFFDEADTLFSKRSEVTSSNDKHANNQTGFLLQCIEDYDGISILATNYKQNIDPAFLRRIKFTVEFQSPDKDMRKLLWENSFPKPAPLSPLIDFDFLSEKFELSGGNIKNIAVNSAFYAAQNNDIIDMKAIVNCLYSELQKNHIITSSIDFDRYSELLDK